MSVQMEGGGGSNGDAFAPLDFPKCFEGSFQGFGCSFSAFGGIWVYLLPPPKNTKFLPLENFNSCSEIDCTLNYF